MYSLYLTLFAEFFKIGLFAVGGGLATLPFLYDLCAKYDWFTKSDLANMIAISESTPGPIGINMATYVGFHTTSGESDVLGGFLNGAIGGVVTTTALVLPSLIIIVILARFLEKFSENKYVNGAFDVLRPTVAGLIGAACFGLYEISFLTMDLFKESFDISQLFDFKAFFVFIFLLFFVFKYKLHPIFYIIIGGVSGVIINMA